MTDLFSPHRDAVVRSLERRFGRELAEDAVHDALASALATGATPANPKAWLHVVAHRRAVDALRGCREAPHAEPPEVGAACDPAEVLARRERVRAVLLALRTIPRRQRDALLLQSLEERSYDEIGARLQVEPENAKQLVSRGRRTLRARVGALVPAPLLARLAEVFHRSFEVATGTAAGRACAGLCVAGAFATFSVEAPVVRQLAVAPAVTATPTPTPPPVVKERRRKAPKRVVATPTATATAVVTAAAAPVTTPPAPTPTPTPRPQQDVVVALDPMPPTSRPETPEAAVKAAAKLKRERQQKIAARIRELTSESSDEERALWLRRKTASGQCPRTPEGIRRCQEKLRAVR